MAASPVTASNRNQPTYQQMIPADEFKEEHLDLPGDKKLFELIKGMANLTGKLTFPGNQWGTGFVQRIRFGRGKCPRTTACEECCNEFAILSVTTVGHFFDKKPNPSKKSNSVGKYMKDVGMELQFKRDEDESYKSLTLYGLRVIEKDKDLGMDSEWCCLEFVSHNVPLVKILKTILTRYQELQGEVYREYKDLPVNLVVVVGYHNCPNVKQISLGKKTRPYEILREVRDNQQWGRYYYDAPTNDGSKGSPVFVLGQPISGFGYWFGHPHNHHGTSNGQKNYREKKSSIGVVYAGV